MNQRLLIALFVLAVLAWPPSAQAQASGSRGPEVYFTPFSHLDFFWGGTREECLARGNGIIAQSIKLAKQSS